MRLQLHKAAFSFLFLSICALAVIGCSQPASKNWMEYIPQKSLALIIPDSGTYVHDFLNESYIPLMDDISPSAIQLISSLEPELTENLEVFAFLMYPDTASEWQPVWITSATRDHLSQILPDYQRDFEQNRYDFQGHTIEKMFISDRILYTFSMADWTAFSESTIALEELIRASGNTDYRLDMSDYNTSADWIVNLGNADQFARHNAQINLYPVLENIFAGAGILPLQFSGNPPAAEWEMSGSVSIDQNSSEFLNIFKTEPSAFTLDRYIPVNASSFFLFRSDPEVSQAPGDTLAVQSEADSFLLENSSFTDRLNQQLSPETAFVTFTRSGPASESEYLFLKSIADSSEFKGMLDHMFSENLAEKDGDTYLFNSQVGAKLFGSRLFSSPNFYLTVYENVIALSLRKGLAESVGGDTARRRVVYYHDGYRAIADAHPSSLTTFFYADAENFETYLQPWLHPQNYLHPLINSFSQIVLTTSFNSSTGELDVSLQNVIGTETEQPYREHWLYPLQDTELTGIPVTGNVTGTSSDEVVFATDSGNVHVLAGDGTSVFQVSTGEDIPVGSPVLYDWYGNNSLVIMQTAGNKIYAWNSNGELLPSFPVVMQEVITTPLIVEDVTSNGMGEMIVATADRRLHILNNQGRPLRGWPQSTNAAIGHKPVITQINNIRSVVAFAENTLHAWTLNGVLQTGFPQFLPVQMNGSPVVADNHIIGSGMDGRLYSAGNTPMFTDSLSTLSAQGSLILESVPISNSSLLASPFYMDDIMLRGDSGLTRGNVIALQASNGSIFLHHSDGRQISVHAMGQPGSAEFSPHIMDLTGDGRNELIALADFGRLYAWDLLSGERLTDLPTAGMTFPWFGNFMNNGNVQIIAQTRDGLICWTIYSSRREALE